MLTCHLMKQQELLIVHECTSLPTCQAFQRIDTEVHLLRLVITWCHLALAMQHLPTFSLTCCSWLALAWDVDSSS